jgi:V8-like Glu-specific endopeptidase
MSRRLLAVSAALILVAVAAPVSADPPDGVPSEHERIVGYWTAQRIRSAIPRDYVVDPATGKVVPQRPGGGGGGGGKPGGGGGGGTAVTGASWNGGGLVKVTTGKVLFTMAGGNYVCSGSVVTDTSSLTSLVLTAGHCVYDEGAGAFATNWAFYPDFDSTPTFDCATATHGCWTATALVTTSAWASSGDFSHDIGFAVIGAGGVGTTGGQLDTTVGAQAIAFNRTHPAAVHAFGYPHASPYNGTDLVYCRGTDFDDALQPGSFTWGLKCNMTGGSSGGPWFVDFNATSGVGTLNSVNSYKYTFDKNTMYGPYFGSWEQKTYNAAAALALAENTTVTYP